MIFKIAQIGDPVLRAAARPLTADEIRGAAIQQLIEWMRETMYDAPGVGLAAPQIGLPLQLAVIEDRADLLRNIPAEHLAERNRKPVPFQVLINPRVETDGQQVEFFEGCLSVDGFAALVPRFTEARVDCLNHRGQSVSFPAEGWHARIVQHEVDHLGGTVYVDRMRARTFTTTANMHRNWAELPIEEVIRKLT